MKNNKKYVSLELALLLKEKGFDLPCEYIYANHCRVKDEILELHPGLSDDGYYELTENGGGNLKEEDVYGNYIEPMKQYGKNIPEFLEYVPGMICTMPTLDDARTWLRNEHSFHVVITPKPDCYKAVLMLPNDFGMVGGSFGATIQIYNPEYLPAHEKSTTFKSYESALETALLEAMKYVDKWNKV